MPTPIEWLAMTPNHLQAQSAVDRLSGYADTPSWKNRPTTHAAERSKPDNHTSYWLTPDRSTVMLNPPAASSHARGNETVPSSWQATRCLFTRLRAIYSNVSTTLLPLHP